MHTKFFTLLFAVQLLVASSPFLNAQAGHWVASWATAIETAQGGDLPPVPLAENTLRQYVRTSIPGKQVRVRFSNAYGDSPVHIRGARVALAEGIGTGGIDADSDRVLSFRGAPGAVLMPGQGVVSDPIALDLPAIADLAISIHFGEISNSRISGHRGSRTDSLIAAGDQTRASDLSSATKVTRWYLIHAVEVLTSPEGRAVSILGDSITDGLGSTTNGQNRWPDQLAKRFQTNPATDDVSVGNMGIGGNAIFGGLGPAATSRFERDVLELTGVRYFILFEGVNDIGSFNDGNAASGAQNLINAYKDFAARAKARGIKSYAATITPLGGYFTTARESARQTVNGYIRNNTDFDGFIDFDAAVRDPANPQVMLPAYSLDGLHLNPTGLQAMADAVPLNLFAL
ncbi:MAG: SGNH/GDSL hydrolase family protein [Akkermansiaceae bacterium]|nr:SGNH/GDSL hydrolase family protein [Akkermansiaceae bacterium]